jgi:hypothetical protein
VEKVIKAGFVEMRDFHAFLGRVCFIVGALEYLRPFLAPLYAWAAAVGRVGRSRLPWSVCFLLSYLATDLGEEGRARTVKPRGLDLGVAFRADAKAEGQLVCVWGLGMSAQLPSEEGKVVFCAVIAVFGSVGVQPRRAFQVHSSFGTLRDPALADGLLAGLAQGPQGDDLG